jgi:aldose 1-epimerase
MFQVSALPPSTRLIAQESHSKITASSMSITHEPYGSTEDGKPVQLYRLTNAHGNFIELTDYGAILVSVNVPDRKGDRANVTLGFDSLDGYLQRHPYFGATVGRFCNRIADGEFEIDGTTYSFVTNNGPNHLHGGTVGFDSQMWEVEEISGDSVVGLRFTLVSPDGQEGYPGTLTTLVEYRWSNDNEMTIHFEATTDAPTHVNLTNHSYFNLGGAGTGKVLDHQMQIDAERFLSVNESMIPTGVLANVADTPLDFRQPHAIGERIEQLESTNGYDHCFVVSGEPGELRSCAVAVDPKSGRAMEVKTTQPGVQLYTGNFLGGNESSNGYGQHSAFCLETQHYPDSPNQPAFPTTLLKPGEQLDETTIYRFFVTVSD